MRAVLMLARANAEDGAPCFLTQRWPAPQSQAVRHYQLSRCSFRAGPLPGRRGSHISVADICGLYGSDGNIDVGYGTRRLLLGRSTQQSKDRAAFTKGGG